MHFIMLSLKKKNKTKSKTKNKKKTYLPLHLLGEYNKAQSTASHLFLQLDIYSRKISCSFDFAIKRRDKFYYTTEIVCIF